MALDIVRTGGLEVVHSFAICRCLKYIISEGVSPRSCWICTLVDSVDEDAYSGPIAKGI